MTREVEKHSENEITAQLGLFGTGLGYRRNWGSRTKEVLDEALELAGLSVEEIDQRGADDELFQSVLIEVLDRAGREPDPTYRHALAQLLALATDEARIDQVTHTLGVLLKLEPLHLRILVMAADFVKPSADEPSGAVSVPTPDEATSVNRRTISAPEMQEAFDITNALALASCQVLEAAGLFEHANPPGEAGWWPTSYGIEALALMFDLV